MEETGERRDTNAGSPADIDIDWTGVQPDRSSIRALDGQTFSARLRRLGERAESLTRLRKAFTDQADGQQLP